MADIELNVEVRDRTGTGGARSVRGADMVPGILYGGGADRQPVAIAVVAKDFRKALYTGKLLGHLITLKYGDERQPVIAKDVQFHPVTDVPVHFDLMRVGEHQRIKIEVPVRFINEDQCKAFRQGGSLEIVRHAIEIMVEADHIPEELIVDLAKRRLGDTLRISDVQLPEGVTPSITDRDFVVASIKISSAAISEAADEAHDAEVAAEADIEAGDAADGDAAEGDAAATDATEQA